MSQRYSKPLLFLIISSLFCLGFTPQQSFAPALGSKGQLSEVLPSSDNIACKPNNEIQGSSDEDLPDFVDILGVSNTLEGTRLTVVFKLRGIPDEITVDQNTLKLYESEIAWGVDIDTDNNPDTGSPNFVIDDGYGYDSIFQSYNFKQSTERKVGIEKFFQYRTFVWNVEKERIRNGVNGKILVDQAEKTITLTASIPDINPDSSLHFYTFYNSVGREGKKEVLIDELCKR